MTISFNLHKTLQLIGSVMFLGALSISLYLNNSIPILLVLWPLVLIDRAFLIPILFTIPLVEGVYATLDTSSNTESIAIAMLAPILGYDLLRRNSVNVPIRINALFVIFIIMTIVGYIVYRQHGFINKKMAMLYNLPAIPAMGKVIAKTFKLLFFIVFIKLLVNYGKEYIYRALSLFRALSPYLILAVVIYTIKFGYVSEKFGGVLHFGAAHHGDFTATLDALAVFLFVAIFERRNNYFEKVLSIAALLFLAYLIMQMGSRNGLLCLCLVAGLSAVLVLAKRSGSMIFLMMLTALAAIVTGVIIFKDSPTVNRFIYEMDVDNGGERIAYWYAGGRALEKDPLLGLGGDESASLYATAIYSPEVEPHIMHDSFLEVAVEYGLLGLLFYIIFVLTIMRWAYQTYMYALKAEDFVLGTPAVGYTVSIFSSLFISRVWETTLFYYLCLIFAIGVLWLRPSITRVPLRRRNVNLPSLQSSESTYGLD